ncbi:MAG TPA: phosphoesterase [Candidatus Sulfotelmatobacter sp.]|nr:phosphoesterase [Candidatus Sulfotelmatobacter sp.]
MIRIHSWLFLLLILFSGAFLLGQSESQRHAVNLPTSKVLTSPAPGRVASTNSFPATIALSPDGHYAALLNDGYGTQETLTRQSIAIWDLESNKLIDFPDDRFREDSHQSYFLGLTFSSNGKHLYVSVGSLSDPTGSTAGDTGNGIAVYSFANGRVAPERFIPIPLQPLSSGKRLAIALKAPPNTAIPYPAGLAVISDHGQDKLLIANNLSDNVILLDPASQKILQTFDLSNNDLVPSAYPYTVVATRDGRRAWCSLWNASQVAELDLTSGKVVRWIKLKQPDDPLAPGSHPTAMLLSPSEKTLYVALSNADQIAEIGTDSGIPFGFRTSSLAGQTAMGNIPVALAQSSDGKRLLVANASLDAVSVFDVSDTSNGPKSGIESNGLLGFIPTDWYPSALAVHGDDLLIATAKGQGTGPNNQIGTTIADRRHKLHPYIATLLRGSVARLNIAATLKDLPQLTQTVERDDLFHSDPGTFNFAGGQNPIKHVVYVIKENRTYDQVLGDLKVGNGDSSLTLYGEDITPNEHRLALQFGVLDNFYDSGEVSGDGHLWSTAAITSDYNEKVWPIAYRGKERTYDFQGQVAEEFPLDDNMPDIDDPGTGFLWDNLARNHMSFRDYGEFVNAEWCNEPLRASNPKEGTPSGQEAECPRTDVKQGGTLPANVGNPHGSHSPWPWAVPLFSGVKPTKAVLRDHYDPLFPDFNTDYPDQLRTDEFLNEFGAFVRARESHEGAQFELPSFILLYLPDDHTGGTRPDRARPAANVADNDLALGRVVDAVSHSPYWDDTAIFVLEDDAQDGADHVDAHRSTAFVISKYSPGSAAKPNVEHRFYTTVNIVHTLESLLGLPPMNQNDAYAPLMTGLFSGEGDQPAYSADYRNLKNGLIYETNKREAPGSKISQQMDFSRPDAAGAAQLNRVLWQDQKGSVPMPVSKHTVFPSSGD